MNSLITETTNTTDVYVIKDILKIKLAKDAQLPKYESQDSSTLYITSNTDVEITPHTIAIVSTGLFVELITRVKIDIQLCQINDLTEKALYILNHPGTIDMDYRGEIKVIIFNFGQKSVKISKGDMIGRLSFNMIKKIQLQLYDANNTQ